MKLIHKNKKAFFDYEILETYLAGIMLEGPEVKSVRLGNVNLKGSYVSLMSDQLVLKGAHIGRYPYDTRPNYDAFRDRKLLLTQKELDAIERKIHEQGVTLVPLAIGLKGRYIKLEIGLVRGKKKYDKRQTLKAKDEKRRVDRIMKNY